MGSLLLSEKQFSEALPYLQRAAVLIPNDYVVLLNLADSNRHLGHAKESRAEYRKSIDLALRELVESPGSGYARAFVAYFAARLGDRKRAEDEIRQALRLAPGDNTVIRRAVLTYEVLGHRDEALAALRGATPDLVRNLSSDPDLADFCQDLRFRQLVAENSK
jgi:serine/threonine-protein kinase